MYKKITIFAIGLLCSVSMQAATISFTGSSKETIEVTPDRKTGLDRVYVIYDMSQVSEMQISGIGSSMKLYRYSSLGGGYAEEVAYTRDGNTAIVAKPEGDMGYIIEEDSGSTYIWVVNYLPHKMQINSVKADEMQECTDTRITIDGTCEAIRYYTIDGRPEVLSREVNVDYYNLEWSEENGNYSQVAERKIVDEISGVIVLTPPLYCNSVVTISGDRFLSRWGMGVSIDSPLIYANGLDVHTTAEQTNLPDDSDPDADPSNMLSTATEGMGGSAPADISFKAYTTDAVIHNEWQIASDAEFEYITYRFNQQDLDYTFTEQGTYYVRFVGSNSDGSCETVGETYTVGIGESELLIPNAFTPDGDGINDVWKVAYRSLIEFRCSIFDRYGAEIISFDDPSQGWDGKRGGKVVKPGVYFYVIEAVGSDGKKYKKSGDINIIGSKRYGESSAGGATE